MKGNPDGSRAGRRKLEFFRQHSYDSYRMVVQADHAAHDVPVASELGSPETVAEDGDVRAVALLFGGKNDRPNNGFTPSVEKKFGVT